MSYPTYTYYCQQTDPAPLMDGLAAVYNNSTNPNLYLEVYDVKLYPAGGSTFTQQNTFTIERITSLDINAIDADPVSPEKHDTNSSDLPSQVLIYNKPQSATRTDVIRRITDNPRFNITSANISITSKLYGMINPFKVLTGANLLNTTGDSSNESITCRENEGIALYQNSFGLNRSGILAFIISVRSTGATYMVRTRDVGTTRRLDKPLFAIFNGSGSGVILDIHYIFLPDGGESYLTPSHQLKIIEGYDNNAVDESSTITSHDTNNPVPSFIKALSGPFLSYPYGARYVGGAYDWYYTHGALGMTYAAQQRFGRIRQRSLGPFGTNAGLSSSFRSTEYGFILFSASRGVGENSPIVLRPGQGLAVTVGREGVIESSCFSFYEISFTFTLKDTTDYSNRTIYAI